MRELSITLTGSGTPEEVGSGLRTCIAEAVHAAQLQGGHAAVMVVLRELLPGLLGILVLECGKLTAAEIVRLTLQAAEQAVDEVKSGQDQALATTGAPADERIH